MIIFRQNIEAKSVDPAPIPFQPQFESRLAVASLVFAADWAYPIFDSPQRTWISFDLTLNWNLEQ